MKTLLLAVLLLLPASLAAAQGAERVDYPRNAIYAELFGNGGVFSINYDRRIREDLALRAGFASWSSEDFWSDNEISITAVPLMAIWLRGSGRHKLEAGGGILAGRREETFGDDGSFVSLIGVLGYRYQREPRGFLFRAGFTPFLGVSGGEAAYPDEGFTPSAGFSFGYGF